MSLKKKIALSFIISAAIIAILAAFEYVNVVKIKTEIRFLELTDTVRTKSLQLRRHEKNFFLYSPAKSGEESASIHRYLEELEAKLVRIIHDRDLKKELSELSITDPLTNVYNRRHLFNRLKEEMVRANRQKRPLSLMLLDLDKFKEFNDTRGHIAGDDLLRNAARLIGKSIREGVDTVYRYGGDEFAVILIDAEPPVAGEIGKRIQQAFKESGEISSSIGWIMYKENMTVTDFISEADRFLYQAKSARKNPSREISVYR